MIYLAKGGGWLFFGNFLGMLSSFLLSILFANFLDKEIYGTYKYVITLLGYFGLFTLSGMGVATIRSVAQNKEGSIHDSLAMMMRWGILGALSSLIMSLYYFFNNNYLLGTSFLIAVFFLPFINVFNVYSPFFRGKKKFDLAIKYDVIIQCAFFGFSVLAILIKPQLPYILLPFLVTYSLFQLLLFIQFKRKYQLNTNKDPEMLKQGLKLSLIYFISLAANSVDKIIIFHFLGPVQLAIYFIALAPVQQLKSAVKIVGQLSLPKLSEKNSNNLGRVVLKKSFLFMAIMLLPIFAYLLIAPYFYSFIYPAYTDSINISRILAFSLIASAGVLPMNYFYSKNKNKNIFKWTVLALIIKTSFMMIGVIGWGLLGIALGFILAQTATFIYSLLLIKYEK